MSDTKKSTARFSALWPTTFLEDSLPGAKDANILLAEMIEEMDAGAADMTTDYLQGNFLGNPHPVVVWLKDCINVSINDYAKNLGIDYEMARLRGGRKTDLRPINEVDRRINFFDGQIGCGSCHNPYLQGHNQLVMSNRRSALCFACHMLD